MHLVNVQCTSNTIQPESRIKKVETQPKKKEKKQTITNDKVQKRSLPRGGNHAEAIERNKSLCDRRPICPTALLLVLHITKSHVAIPHIYTSFLGISHTFHLQSKTFRPQVHWSIFLLHCPSSSLQISLFFYLPLRVLSSCPSLLCCVSRGLQVQELFLSADSLSSSWSQTKHRKKMCLSVLLVVCMHMHGRSSVLFCSSFVPCPSSDVSECNVLVFPPHVSFPALHPPPPSSCYLCCYSGTAGEGWEGNCPLIFSPPLFKLPPSSSRCPSSILSSSKSSTPSTPLRPRSLVRLDSGWSHSWARCRAARQSRSLHSCRWTWGPGGACWGHPAGGDLLREPGSRRRSGPRSFRCQAGEDFGKEGRVLKVGLEKRPVKKNKNHYWDKRKIQMTSFKTEWSEVLLQVSELAMLKKHATCSNEYFC